MTTRTARGAGTAPARLAGITAVLVGSLGLLTTVPTSDAAFSRTTSRPSTFVADVLNPPGGLDDVRRCLSPSYVASSANGSTTTNSVVARPAGVVAGDVLVAWAVTAGAVPITTDAGWTQLHEMASAGGNMRGSVFWRRVGASEPTSYTFTWQSSGLASISGYTGVLDPTSVDASAIEGSAAQTTTATTPAVTTSVAQTRLLHHYWIQYATSATYSAPELRQRLTLTTPWGGLMSTLDEARPVAGATSPRTLTYSPAQFTMRSVVALRPAATNTSRITLNWTATPDTYATGYRLTRNGGASTSIAGRTTTSRTETDVVDTTSYAYDLRSVFSSWTSAAATVTSDAC